MNGIIIIDKPERHTSFDVVAILRKLCGERRMGHTGTLDPMATGVLPVLMGQACRASDLLPVQDKEYIAGFRFGSTSDTEDVWGDLRVVSDSPVTFDALERVAEGFRGEISQIPPMYSAVKKDGQRLYTLARQGIVVERKPKTVTVHALEFLSYDEGRREGVLRLHGSKGTYVRSIISGLGDALGVGGVMTALRRTKASGFSLEQSITLEQARALHKQGGLADQILPVEQGFLSLSVLYVSEKQAIRFKNGGGLDLERVPLSALDCPADGLRVRVRAPDETFLGLGALNFQKNELSVFRLFCGGVQP